MKILLITLTILQSLLSTMEQKTLVTDITLTQTESAVANANNMPFTHTGTMTMRGKQFALNILGLEAAYDGTTLYVYSEDTEELTLSTPGQEELLQTNPFLYAQALMPLCQYAEKVVGDKTQVTLTPRDMSLGVKKLIIRVVTNTLLPYSVEIHESDGKVTSIKLSNASYKKECPSFTISKPEAFVNDLR